MKLFELFDKTAKYKLETATPHRRIYRFQINNHEFAVDIEKVHPLLMAGNSWYFSFYQDDATRLPRHDVTGLQGKNAIRVFSTVVTVLKDFVDRNKPDYLLYSIDNEEEKRTNIYGRILGKFPGHELFYTKDKIQGSKYYAIKINPNAENPTEDAWERIK